ncbi:MAG: hypothetical protein AB7O24_30915 [Kofleriaceae bacterium]
MARRDLGEIDRLIEDGLVRYGQGDLDGALQLWDQALVLDPENPAAQSYVDYVRANYYDLVSADANTADYAPFPIGDDEPEYQIEIVPGEAIPDRLSAPMFMDPLDEAWFIEDELISPAGATSLEIEAGEPPALTFEDQTREYSQPSVRGRINSDSLPEPVTTEYRTDDFMRPEVTPAFGSPQDLATPNSFAAQSTEVRRRDLGFVKPRVPTGGSFAGSGGSPAGPSEHALDAPSAAYAAHLAARDGAGEPLESATTQDFDKHSMPLVQPPRVPPGAVVAPPDDPLVTAPTRELGMRPPRLQTEDEPTNVTSPLRDLRRGTTETSPPPPIDPLDAKAAEILDEIDVGAPIPEPPDEQIRRRITKLIERATEWVKAHQLDRAVMAAELALSEAPGSALAQKLTYRNRDAIMSVFHAFLGDLDRQPALARPLHELSSAAINPRAAFLLSRVDGMLSIDEILDVSGMPRIEACRYLCQLLVRGILR